MLGRKAGINSVQKSLYSDHNYCMMILFILWGGGGLQGDIHSGKGVKYFLAFRHNPKDPFSISMLHYFCHCHFTVSCLWPDGGDTQHPWSLFSQKNNNCTILHQMWDSNPIIQSKSQVHRQVYITDTDKYVAMHNTSTQISLFVVEHQKEGGSLVDKKNGPCHQK